MSEKTKTANSLPLKDTLASLIGLASDGTMGRMKQYTAVFPPESDLNNVTSPGLYRYTAGVLHRPHQYGVAIVMQAEIHLIMVGISQTQSSNMIAVRFWHGSTKNWTTWLSSNGAEIQEVNT